VVVVSEIPKEDFATIADVVLLVASDACAVTEGRVVATSGAVFKEADRKRISH
jgi:hypothetical protein